MRRLRGRGRIFDKEYLFGFETLVFATSGNLSMHNQLVTLEIASYDPFKQKCKFFISFDQQVAMCQNSSCVLRSCLL